MEQKYSAESAEELSNALYKYCPSPDDIKNIDKPKILLRVKLMKNFNGSVSNHSYPSQAAQDLIHSNHSQNLLKQ